MTYGALFYVVDLEAVKAGMTGLPGAQRRSWQQGLIKAAITICSVIILSGAIYWGLGWTRHVFGEAASWGALAFVGVAYVLLVANKARHPDLPLDDPNRPLVAVPDFYETVRTGLHYLLPVSVLIWCLMVEEMSPGLAAFWGVVAMGGLVLTQKPLTTFSGPPPQATWHYAFATAAGTSWRVSSSERATWRPSASPRQPRASWWVPSRSPASAW